MQSIFLALKLRFEMLKLFAEEQEASMEAIRVSKTGIGSCFARLEHISSRELTKYASFCLLLLSSVFSLLFLSVFFLFALCSFPFQCFIRYKI